MIVFGHKNIKYKTLYFTKQINDIENSSNNSILINQYSESNIKFYEYCLDNNLLFAIVTKSLKEIIISISYEPTYIIVDKSFAQNAQKFVDNYLLDVKILLIIENEDDMVQSALDEMDGVIFSDLLNKLK